MDETTLLAALTTETGLINAARAYRAGIGADRIAALQRTGQLARVAKGWYALEPVGSPERRHLLSARALVATFGDRAVASHQTAIVWHGLPVLSWSPRTVHLTRTRDEKSRRRSGLVLHPRPVGWTEEPIVVVDPATAVVQYGHQSGLESAVVAGDAALRGDLVSVEQLAAAVDLAERVPGNAASRAALPLFDHRSESPGESRLRVRMVTCGYAVTPQVEIPSVGARVDLLLDDAPVIVEFDGRGKYAQPQDLYREKVREDRVRDRGFEMVRFIWRELDDLGLIRHRVDRAIVRSSGRRAHF